MAKKISELDILENVTSQDYVEVSEFVSTEVFSSKRWAPGTLANEDDAPSDAALYGRKNGLWTEAEPAFAKNTAFNKNFGSAADTVTEGSDARLSDAREWAAETASQVEAEDGTSTARKAWTAERVWQAVVAAVEAIAVVYSSDSSLTPAAGKIPIARADSTLDPGWISPDTFTDNFVGIAYNRATEQFTRLGAGRDTPVGEMLSPAHSPVLANLRRVALTDAGEVYKGVSWLDFTQHEDATAVALDGTNGQIMVEYKAAYIKTGIVGDWAYVMISHLPLADFFLHPVFQSPADIIYRGAYEASVYDGKLCSIAKSPVDGTSDVFPVTTRTGDWGHAGLTTAATETLAAARNAGGVTGWRQSSLLDYLWERTLMLVAFGTYNVPGVVGDGRINLSGGGWTNGSYVGKCGLGDTASGYHSAVQAGGTAGHATDYAQVLGIENPWGNIWERTASLSSDGALYYMPDPPYDYSTTTAWTRLLDAADQGITLPTIAGYAGTPHTGLGLVLPADVTGSSSAGMYDYYLPGSGLKVLRGGGHADYGADAGPFCVLANASATVAYAYVGGRLCFIKRAA